MSRINVGIFGQVANRVKAVWLRCTDNEDGTGTLQVAGPTTEGAAAVTGNPVQVGGTSVVDGNVQSLRFGYGGGVFVEGATQDPADPTGVTEARPVKVGFKVVNPDSLPTDASVGDTVNGVATVKRHQLVHLATKIDSTNDSISSHTNSAVTALASAARTADTNSADLTNNGCSGADIIIDVTAASATPSVVFTITGKDALSGQYYTLLASAAITGIGTTVLRIHPGLTAAANAVANFGLPKTFRVQAVHADSDSITYSVGVNLIR